MNSSWGCTMESESGPSRYGGEKKLVVLDPGHGGSDPGAVAREGSKECDLALEYAESVEADLACRAPEIEVIMTHRGEGCSLADRVTRSNTIGADLFVSIHCNAAESTDAHGFEIFTSRGQTGADRVATMMFKLVQHELPDQFRPRTDWEDGDPDREANFYVLRKTQARAVLVELGFISNDHDRALLKNETIRKRWTKSMTDAIMLTI